MNIDSTMNFSAPSDQFVSRINFSSSSDQVPSEQVPSDQFVSRINFSLIAAVTRDYGLGNNGQLPWTRCRLDMNWFRRTTANSTIIMGRRTFESFGTGTGSGSGPNGSGDQGHGPDSGTGPLYSYNGLDRDGGRDPGRNGSYGLPGRINIVLTRNSEIRCPVKKRKLDTDVSEVYYCNSFDHALIIARYYNRPIFVIGGSEVYREALSYDVCKEILLTHLDIKLPVTCYFPLFSAEHYEIKSIIDAGTTDVVSGNKEQQVKYEIIRYGKPESISRTDSLHESRIDSLHESIPRVTNLTGPSYNYFGESGYLKCIRDILRYCESKRDDRTGVGTLALYGTSFRYDLSRSFPLFTTKRVFWKGVVAELLWFLSGSTDVGVLQQQGVHIWDGNSSREFLDKVGLHRNPVNDIGASYGFQFRHSGTDYRTGSGSGTGLGSVGNANGIRSSNFVDQNSKTGVDQNSKTGVDQNSKTGVDQNSKTGVDQNSKTGTDQVAYVINELKTNPMGRRAIINLWNPSDLPKMAIPPCLYSYQFWVDNSGGLSCLINQRSGDLGLGIPFNVASASLLTYMIGHLTGLRPKELIHNVADTHVYLSHVEQLKTQIKRVVRPHPILQIIDRKQSTIDDFIKTDFQLFGYYPDEAIKMDMAV